MLKVIVFIKQTFDTEEKVTIENGAVIEDGAKFVINPYDEYALEEAVRIKEQSEASITVISVGSERCVHALRSALAVGADQAIWIDAESYTDILLDSTLLAQLLAEATKPLQPDLILAGLFAIDSGSSSVALQVAELLHLPHISAATKLQLGTQAGLGINNPAITAAKYALVERDVEGDTETMITALPALITAQQGLNEPRYPSLPNIMKAKKKLLTTIAVTELLQAEASLSMPSATTIRCSIQAPKPRNKVQFISGTTGEQVKTLLGLLSDNELISKGGKA